MSGQPQATSTVSPESTPPPLSVVIDSSGKQNGEENPSAGDSPLETAVDSSTALILLHDEDDDNEEDVLQQGYDRDPERPFALDVTSEDEDHLEDDDPLAPLYPGSTHRWGSRLQHTQAVPPLSPSTIFMYLLSPYLKLGALLLPSYQLPLRYGLAGVFVFAFLAVLGRHLLYLLARYLRCGVFEEVVCEALGYGEKVRRGKSRRERRRRKTRREVMKILARFVEGLMKILLGVLYLRECVLFTFPIIHTNPSQRTLLKLVLALGFTIFALLLSLPKSLASRLVHHSTQFSIFTYLLWFASTIYCHTQGILPINPDRFGIKNILYGLAVTAFTLSSSNTLSLYASLKGTSPALLFSESSSISPPGSPSASLHLPTQTQTQYSRQNKFYRSFKILSLLAIGLATAIMLPLVVIASNPKLKSNANSVVPTLNGFGKERLNILANYDVGSRLPPTSVDTSGPLFSSIVSSKLRSTQIQSHVAPVLATLTLLCGLPQILITIPPAPPKYFFTSLFRLDQRRRNSSNWDFLDTLEPYGKVLGRSLVGIVLAVLTCLSVLFDAPRSSLAPRNSGVNRESIDGSLSAILTIALACFSTYYLPALLHVLIHTFKSPLAIVLPVSHSPSASPQNPVPASDSSPPSAAAPSAPHPALGVTLTSAPPLTLRQSSQSQQSTHSSTLTATLGPAVSQSQAASHPTASTNIPNRSTSMPVSVPPSPAVPARTPAYDVLLQRKERALQKRQLRRRIAWDLSAWIVVLGGVGLVGLGVWEAVWA